MSIGQSIITTAVLQVQVQIPVLSRYDYPVKQEKWVIWAEEAEGTEED